VARAHLDPEKQRSAADWETGEEKDVGRRPARPVLPPRAVPVVEAMLYCTVLDFMLLAGRINPDRVDGNPGSTTPTTTRAAPTTIDILLPR